MSLVSLLGRCFLAALCLPLVLCSCSTQAAPLNAAAYGLDRSDPLTGYALTGDIQPIHDPSLIRQGSTWYLFTTDVLGLPPTPSLPIRCSKDEIDWQPCGSVFPGGMPRWIRDAVPGILGLWAPDISYFNGLYHVYYAASTLNSQRSVIALATNTTLDPADPDYHWVDRGPVLSSNLNDDFNAIDPNLFLDPASGRAWMSYGSYWSGIKQIEIDPDTGMTVHNAPRYDLATRPNVVNDPIEGPSLVFHNGFYYLFVSIDYCCNRDVTSDNYKQAVGRGTSPHGPFVDSHGTPMMSGGGDILLQGDEAWAGPAGGSVYLGPGGESTLVFHALHLSEDGAMYLWLKHLTWQDDWPALQ